jgi:hypothetical protein
MRKTYPGATRHGETRKLKCRRYMATLIYLSFAALPPGQGKTTLLFELGRDLMGRSGS